jgi:hypothetical protein
MLQYGNASGGTKLRIRTWTGSSARRSAIRSTIRSSASVAASLPYPRAPFQGPLLVTTATESIAQSGT